jgi:hypothetical protein
VIIPKWAREAAEEINLHSFARGEISQETVKQWAAIITSSYLRTRTRMANKVAAGGGSLGFGGRIVVACLFILILLVFVTALRADKASAFIPKNCLGKITITDFIGACDSIRNSPDEAICKVRIHFNCVHYRTERFTITDPESGAGDSRDDMIFDPTPFPNRPQLRVLRVQYLRNAIPAR